MGKPIPIRYVAYVSVKYWYVANTGEIAMFEIIVRIYRQITRARQTTSGGIWVYSIYSADPPKVVVDAAFYLDKWVVTPIAAASAAARFARLVRATRPFVWTGQMDTAGFVPVPPQWAGGYEGGWIVPTTSGWLPREWWPGEAIIPPAYLPEAQTAGEALASLKTCEDD
jgi:hypothetical protein